jgi:hypothetical protein
VRKEKKMSQPWYILVLPTLPVLLAYLAGVVVAVILVVRHRSTPAILALVGFGVLFLVALAGLGHGPLSRFLAEGGGMGRFGVDAGVGCCCSVFDVIAVVCLIVAVWQAVSGGGAGADVAGSGAVEAAAGDEGPGAESTYATEILEGTVEEIPQASDEDAAEAGERTTRVLDETREDDASREDDA